MTNMDSMGSSSRTTTESAPSLARRLGLFDYTLLVMGTVIGSGIFVMPHTVAGLVRSPVLVLAAWVVGGIYSLAGSLVYAELTSRRPEVGGQYAFLREAYHPIVAFLYGWALLLVIQSGGMAFVAGVFADYSLELMKQARHTDIPAYVRPTVIVLAIGLLSLINCAGVRRAGTTQNLFMILKIAAILMLILCGMWIAAGETTSAPDTPKSLDQAKPFWAMASAFGAALVAVFFSYGGWHTSTFVAGEIKEPERTMPRGLVVGVTGVILLYLGVNYACLHALGSDVLAASKAPAAKVMEAAWGQKGATLISIGIAVSALGFLFQSMLTSPRVYYAMAADGIFFQAMAWIHQGTRVPVLAIVLQGAAAAVIALTGKAGQIVNYVMSVEMIFLTLTALSLFALRNRAAENASAHCVRAGHPVTTMVFVLVNVVLLVNLFWTAPENSLIGLGIALAGIPAYLVWRSPSRGEMKSNQS
jgi:APA family basic amino acid/polyamine antiporter